MIEDKKLATLILGSVLNSILLTMKNVIIFGKRNVDLKKIFSPSNCISNTMENKLTYGVLSE